MEKFTKLKYSEISTKKVSTYETSFELQPLEQGFANTLGNAVRRVLLSSIQGVAPFAVKIKGIDHEFQTIPGVVEDVVHVILNLKKVRFFYNQEVFADGEVIRVSLSSSKGDVTAQDFKLPAGVQIVNPEQLIATTSKANALDIELFLIVGRGFVTFEENKMRIKELSPKIESHIDGAIIAIDSDFSPVVNVSYQSVELNSSAAIVQEKLIFNVKTDGSVDAKDAIASAAHILISHLEVLSNVGSISKDDIFEEVVQENKRSSSVAPIKIVQLDLSVRSYKCLKRAGYETIDDIAKVTIKDLEQIKNLGRKSITEIVDKLKEYEIDLEEGE